MHFVYWTPQYRIIIQTYTQLGDTAWASTATGAAFIYIPPSRPLSLGAILQTPLCSPLLHIPHIYDKGCLLAFDGFGQKGKGCGLGYVGGGQPNALDGRTNTETEAKLEQSMFFCEKRDITCTLLLTLWRYFPAEHNIQHTYLRGDPVINNHLAVVAVDLCMWGHIRAMRCAKCL